MVARNAREILKKENKMLDDLVQRATEFAKQTVDKEFVDDLNSWVDDLVGYREINQNLINMTDDKAFDDALGEEITILKPCVGPLQVRAKPPNIEEELLGDIDTSRVLIG